MVPTSLALAFALVLAFAPAEPPALTSSLSKIPFANNSGTVSSTGNFTYVGIPALYLEPEAPTRARWAWADTKTHQYLFGANATPPPLGMRSAPPLGGLAAGTVELRADGSLHAWTLENASPAGSTKIATLDDALFGLRVGDKAVALRTTPPAGIPGVDSLDFAGLQPFVRLTPHGEAIPDGLASQLYGRSSWRIGDLDGSSTPAAAFTVSLTNPDPTAPLEVSFFLSLPLSLQRGTARPTTEPPLAPTPQSRAARTAEACLAACAGLPGQCASWWLPSDSNCTLLADVAPLVNSPHAASGVAGAWVAGRSADCLTLQRPGMHAAAGNATLCGAAEGASASSVTAGSAATLKELWTTFASTGGLLGAAEDGATHGVGALAVRMTLAPNSTGSATVALGWFFPYRDYMGEVVGNHYSTLVADAEEAAAALLPSREGAAEVAELAAYQDSFLGADSSMPVWLADTLVNSLHHTRSAFRLGDGRWRQWEAYDCVNIDSVHNDGERHIPYLMFWPETVVSKMKAWAAGALADGMIQEQLGCGCEAAVPKIIDQACGRVMGDVSSMFVVYLLELHQWGAADNQTVASLWPAAKRAAQWQMARAEELGLPDHVVDTYDILDPHAAHNASAFSSFFHLLAMRAAAKLARAAVVDDPAFAASCDGAFARGQAALETLLWNATAGYYRSYTGGDAVMSDALYAQVLADTLGLGPLAPREQVLAHLRHVNETNGTPYGFLIQTGRYPYPGPAQDNAVWMMANPNWASLALWRGVAAADALQVAQTALGRWREAPLNDLWNVAGVVGGLGYGAEGMPYITSHYGYYMSAWHLVFALSGQAFDAPSGSLAFAPKLPPPFSLPVLTPKTVASIAATADGRFTLRVRAGKPLRLSAVRVGEVAAPAGVVPAVLGPGESITWKKERDLPRRASHTVVPRTRVLIR